MFAGLWPWISFLHIPMLVSCFLIVVLHVFVSRSLRNDLGNPMDTPGLRQVAALRWRWHVLAGGLLPTMPHCRGAHLPSPLRMLWLARCIQWTLLKGLSQNLLAIATRTSILDYHKLWQSKFYELSAILSQCRGAPHLFSFKASSILDDISTWLPACKTEVKSAQEAKNKWPLYIPRSQDDSC